MRSALGETEPWDAGVARLLDWDRDNVYSERTHGK